jgi:alpha,alpha-trehalase
VVVEIAENMLYLLRRFGRIPNASRYYFLSRSQPPFLTSMLRAARAELQRAPGAREPERWLTDGADAARREYEQVWCGSQFPDFRKVYRGLSRYYDLNIWHNAAEAESGWDMTPRFEDRCLDFLPVDLNSLLYRYECDFAWFARDDETESKSWRERAEGRRQQTSDLMWEQATGFFYDYDYSKTRRSEFRSLAGFFPMWAGLARPEQAASMVERHLPFFETPHGLVTAEQAKHADGGAPKQWGWPNGWAPLHWIVVSGLWRYGFEAQARRIAEKWVRLVAAEFEAHGQNYEKYNVVEGRRASSERYPDQAGFGWTNAIFVRMVRLLDGEKPLEFE